MSADIVIGFNHEDREARLARQDGGGQTYRARADHDDVGFKVPLLRQNLSSCLSRAGSAESER